MRTAQNCTKNMNYNFKVKIHTRSGAQNVLTKDNEPQRLDNVCCARRDINTSAH